MSNLINWILCWFALVFLAPLLSMAHQDLHARFILTISQFNSQLAERAFTTWQVVVSGLLVLTIIGCYLSVRQGKYQLVMPSLLIGVLPILFTYLILVSVTWGSQLADI